MGYLSPIEFEAFRTAAEIAACSTQQPRPENRVRLPNAETAG